MYVSTYPVGVVNHGDETCYHYLHYTYKIKNFLGDRVVYYYDLQNRLEGKLNMSKHDSFPEMLKNGNKDYLPETRALSIYKRAIASINQMLTSKIPPQEDVEEKQLALFTQKYLPSELQGELPPYKDFWWLKHERNNRPKIALIHQPALSKVDPETRERLSKLNRMRADYCRTMAMDAACQEEQRGEYRKYANFFLKASFAYHSSFDNYQDIPGWYEEMGDTSRARLARIQLAYYHVFRRNLEEIETLLKEARNACPFEDVNTKISYVLQELLVRRKLCEDGPLNFEQDFELANGLEDDNQRRQFFIIRALKARQIDEGNVYLFSQYMHEAKKANMNNWDTDGPGILERYYSSEIFAT